MQARLRLLPATGNVAVDTIPKINLSFSTKLVTSDSWIIDFLFTLIFVGNDITADNPENSSSAVEERANAGKDDATSGDVELLLNRSPVLTPPHYSAGSGGLTLHGCGLNRSVKGAKRGSTEFGIEAVSVWRSKLAP